MGNILIIDDDKKICETIAHVAAPMGHDVVYDLTLGSALGRLSSNSFDIVFLDVRLPDGNGLTVLPRIREAANSPEVIVITGEGEPDGAELAVKHGAWDYIEKPLSVEAIRFPLIYASQYRDEKKTKTTSKALKRGGIIGKSREIGACLDLLSQAASSESNVLITGETGTGKELFARAIHDNSSRATKDFVVVDCAALPETLVVSTLFGHEKGAFTGADKAQEGLVYQAHGGTLFLDEVGELPLSAQRALLRVLQERRFRPVGGRQELESDFRLMSATNRDLDQMVHARKFRSDLLFRLRSILIGLPPLRERKTDIKELATYYVNKFCRRYSIPKKSISPEFMEALNAFSWRGNVRELVHAMESALSAVSNGSTLFPIHLPKQIRIQLARASVAKVKLDPASVESDTSPVKKLPNHREYLAIKEREYFQGLISCTGGNMKEARRISKLPRATFYYRLKKYDIRA